MFKFSVTVYLSLIVLAITLHFSLTYLHSLYRPQSCLVYSMAVYKPALVYLFTRQHPPQGLPFTLMKFTFMSYKMGSEYTSNPSKGIDEVQHKPDVFFFFLPIVRRSTFLVLCPRNLCNVLRGSSRNGADPGLW